MEFLPLLNILAIVSIGTMIGVELCVAVFINPIIRRLSADTQEQILPHFAKRLGAAMPFWYGANLVMLLVQTFYHRGTGHFVQDVVASSIWAAVILFTILILVPINNRIAKLDPAATPDWQAQYRRWDILHYLRVVLLLAAFVIVL